MTQEQSHAELAAELFKIGWNAGWKESQEQAALACGPQGRMGTIPVESAIRIHADSEMRAIRAEVELQAMESRALAAEARVKELEGKLSDAALVEAGWIPVRSVCHITWKTENELKSIAFNWLPSRAAQSAEKQGGA